MTLETLIHESFPHGLDYDDAAQLCLTLYCTNFLPDELSSQCTKENLPIILFEICDGRFHQINRHRHFSTIRSKFS